MSTTAILNSGSKERTDLYETVSRPNAHGYCPPQPPIIIGQEEPLVTVRPETLARCKQLGFGKVHSIILEDAPSPAYLTTLKRTLDPDPTRENFKITDVDNVVLVVRKGNILKPTSSSTPRDPL